jgi:hypothetical protein
MKKLVLFLCVLVFASACASVPMGDPQQDAFLKTFVSPEETAGLYVYRNETFGAAVKMNVLVDNKTLGATAAKTYLYTELSPGEHTVTSLAENTETLKIDVKAGGLYYIWQEVKMGVLYARNKLHLIDDEEKGKAGVLQTKLAASNSIVD